MQPEVVKGAPAYLSSEQVCRILGLSYEAVLRAVRRGELKAVKVCGRLRFPVHALPGVGAGNGEG